MKKLFCLFLISLFFFGAHAQILRPFTSRYSNSSVRGNIVYVANNIITSANASTSEAPPGGVGVNNGNIASYIDADGDAATFMSYGSLWKYLDNNTRPVNWQTSAFNDATWSAGNGELGYGDGDETTIVNAGCTPVASCGTKYITTYFRRTVNIPNPSAFTSLIVNLKRDDGIVLYLNGVEVHRSNMPGGAPVHGTLATAAVEGATEFVTFTIPSASFLTGNNVFAAEVHQTTATSTDVSFDMELKRNTTPIPYASTWNYSNTNVEPAGWPNLTTLPSGPGAGPLGFGEAVTTTLTDRKTYYFLKQVTISNLSDYSALSFGLNYDDGAIVFVNGQEVGRINMAAGDPDFTTNALSNVENLTANFTVPASAPFVTGTNYIQVEVHSSGDNEPGTDDLRFDLQLAGGFSNTTFSSSAASINLSSCSHVLWAGLYWGASQGTDGTNASWITGETSVKFKLPGAASYQTINSQQTDYHNGALVPGLPHTGYRSFADITSLLNTTNPNGLYYIADVVGPNGIINGSGGWTIVIVYSNPNEAPRNLTVFDGSAIMNGGDPSLQIPITGFVTPPSGPVSCELGAVVYDGDRTSLDEFSFKQDSNPAVGTYTSLTPNATSNVNDMWNSTISYKGTVVTSRFPAHLNTLGYDADIIEVPNAGNTVLGNNQTSGSIQFSAPSENYFIHVGTT